MDIDKARLKLLFPSYFPLDNLPIGAKEENIYVYRICKTGKIDSDSFLTTYEENIKFKRDLKGVVNIPNVDNCSMSCYEKLKDILRLLSCFTKNNPQSIIAYGSTDPSCGLSQRTKDRLTDTSNKRKSHVDWWLYKNVTPEKYFKEINEDEYT